MVRASLFGSLIAVTVALAGYWLLANQDSTTLVFEIPTQPTLVSVEDRGIWLVPVDGLVLAFLAESPEGRPCSVSLRSDDDGELIFRDPCDARVWSIAGEYLGGFADEMFATPAVGLTPIPVGGNDVRLEVDARAVRDARPLPLIVPRPDGPVRVIAGGALFVWLVPDGDTVRAFRGRSPHGDGCPLDFVAPGIFTDRCTGSAWDIAGSPSDGQSERLVSLPIDVRSGFVTIPSVIRDNRFSGCITHDLAVGTVTCVSSVTDS